MTSTKSSGTQTDFPASMLEDYVVRNRKRILKLLGITQSIGELVSAAAFVDMTREHGRFFCPIEFSLASQGQLE